MSARFPRNELASTVRLPVISMAVMVSAAAAGSVKGASSKPRMLGAKR